MQTMKIPQGTKELNIQQYADKIVIEFVPEKKMPIFITEDGVELHNPDDECWYVRLRDNGIGEQPFVHKEMAYHVNFKYFSTRKAAEEYVAKGKKIEKIRWRARHGENYWAFNGQGSFETFDIGFTEDIKRYNDGFYFQTQEQAEKARMATINLLLTTEF